MADENAPHPVRLSRERMPNLQSPLLSDGTMGTVIHHRGVNVDTHS